MTSKKITLEKLARMIERGFAEVATKKELNDLRAEIHGRFEDMDNRFEGIEKRFDALVEILRLMQKESKEWREGIESELFDLRERISHLERRVGARK